MTVEGTRSEAQWRLYLAEYSVEVLESADENANLEISDQQRADRWLGFDGADTDQLAELEQRLGIGLPPSYRTFLAVSDGWLELGPFLWTMRTTGEVGWARDTDRCYTAFFSTSRTNWRASRTVRCSSPSKETPSTGYLIPAMCPLPGNGRPTPGPAGIQGRAAGSSRSRHW